MQKENDINEIIEKYSDMVYRIALTRTGCIENAEDIFQDVFIKCMVYKSYNKHD